MIVMTRNIVRRAPNLLWAIGIVLFSACSSGVQNPPPTAIQSGECQTGEISYYAPSLAGRKTANGEIYDHEAMTAAHRTLPFGTTVTVEHEGHSVELRVNDRGPFAKGRILDVSGRAARELKLTKKGHGFARVCVEGRGE